MSLYRMPSMYKGCEVKNKTQSALRELKEILCGQRMDCIGELSKEEVAEVSLQGHVQ